MEQATADRGPEGAASLPPGEQHAVTTSDGTEIRLTRYALGTKGPIVLAPGYGNAARAFAIDTVPKNWVQYLGEHGYDVWLLDYRASPDLPSSWRQFTVDDIAMRDWPAAIDRVRLETGHDQVQAMGHCVGGLSLFMAIGGGLDGLRSAMFSALAGHPIPTVGNQIRAGIRLASVFKTLGIDGLNTDYDPHALPDKAVELPVMAVSTALQFSLRAQQRYAELTLRGDELISRLHGLPEEPPDWATFDDEPSPEPATPDSAAPPLAAAPATPPTSAAKQPRARKSAPAKKTAAKQTAAAKKTRAGNAKSTKRTGAKTARAKRSANPSAFDAVDEAAAAPGEAGASPGTSEG